MGDWRELLKDIYAEIKRQSRESVAGFTRGGKLDLSSPNIVGHLPPSRGGTGGTTGGTITPDQVRDAGRWELVTNGDPDYPEFVFADGDAVYAWVEG